MATAGAAIASVTAAAEAIAAAAAPWPIAAVLRAEAGAGEHAAGLFAPAVARFVATRELIVPAERVPARAMRQRLAPAAVVDRTRRQRIAAEAAAVMPVAAVDMPAAVVVVVVVVVMPAVAVVADTGNLNTAA